MHHRAFDHFTWQATLVDKIKIQLPSFPLSIPSFTLLLNNPESNHFTPNFPLLTAAKMPEPKFITYQLDIKLLGTWDLTECDKEQ